MLIVTGEDSWASETVKGLRKKCREDTLFLAREILGEEYATHNGGVNYFRTPAPYHLEANAALNSLSNAIILAPRGHLKTEFITIAGTVNFLLRNPNHRVLIVSETPRTAMKSLRAIKGAFQDNVRVRNLFPEYRIDSTDEEGTQNWFDVACRNGPKKDFSVEVIGATGATAGGHYDRIVTTDIVSDLTVPPAVTLETMQKTISRMDTLEPLLNHTNKRSHIIIEGTVWALGDPYCYVLANPGYADFKKIVYSCWAKDDKGEYVLTEDGKRTPMWPVLHTTENLERIRSKNSYMFSCYYENDPQPSDEDRLFLPSYFKPYEAWEGKCPACGGEVEIRVTADLAISQAKTADYTALPVSAVCAQGHLSVLDIPRGRWTPYETVEKLYELDAIWKPSFIGVESVAWQKAMMYILAEEAKKRYPLPVWEMTPDNSPNGKLRRISMLSSYAASRGVWVRPGDHDVLVDEALRMSRRGSLGGHDDLVDALAYVCYWILQPSGPVLDVTEKPRVIEGVIVGGASCLKGSDVLALLDKRARGASNAIS